MTSAEKHPITLQGRQINYALKYSNRARRLRISVSDSGVSLILPEGFPRAKGEAFLQQNAAWVMEQLERRARRKLAAAPTLPKDVVLFHGEPTRIEVVEEAQRKARARVDVGRGKLLIRVPPGGRERAYEALAAWLRETARAEIEQTAALQAERMRVRYNDLTIRDQRTRWGSCSSRGTLSFNWRLVMAPHTIMEYVVVHELSHLTVPNHSKEFWQRVALFYPEFKKARLWLKKNAPLLYPPGLTQL